MIGTVFLHRVHLFAGAHIHLLLSLLVLYIEFQVTGVIYSSVNWV